MAEIRDDSEYCRRGRSLPKEEVDLSRSKKVLCVGSFEEQLRVAKIITGLNSKILNTDFTGNPININPEEAELISEIVVSSEKFK